MRLTLVCPIDLVPEANAMMQQAGIEGEVFDSAGGWDQQGNVVSVASGVFSEIPPVPLGVTYNENQDIQAALTALNVSRIEESFE